MGNFKILLAVYYTFLSIYLMYLLIILSKNKKMDMIMLVRIMYILIYGVVPIITIKNVINNGITHKTISLDINEGGINQLILASVLEFIGFIALEIGFNMRKSIKIKDNNHTYEINEKSLIKSANLMIVISIISLFIWTYPFGGPIEMFKYGSLIRSGQEISNIKNSYGFFKHFVPLAQFSSVIYLALFIKNKKLKDMIPFLISFTTSIVYLIANDGRAPFLMYIMSLLILYTRLHNKSKMKKPSYLKYFIIVIIGYFFITNIYAVTSIITGNKELEKVASINVFDFLFNEFSWTVRNIQAVQIAISKGKIYRIFLELLSAVFALIPSRFRPEWLPRLEKINTVYWYNGLTAYGGMPPDLITTSIYVLGYPGVVVIPFVFGCIVRRFNNYFIKTNNDLYSNIIFVQMIYQLIKVVAYADFALISLNLFYLLIGHYIVKMCCKKENKT